MIHAGEIYFVAGVEIGVCANARPCIVLQVRATTALICILSAQFDLAEGHEVTILTTDADFPASGLERDSFIPEFAERWVEISVLKKANFLGQAVGDFKRKVENWCGVTF